MIRPASRQLGLLSLSKPWIDSKIDRKQLDATLVFVFAAKNSVIPLVVALDRSASEDHTPTKGDDAWVFVEHLNAGYNKFFRLALARIAKIILREQHSIDFA
jgi:hypothetical protein